MLVSTWQLSFLPEHVFLPCLFCCATWQPPNVSRWQLLKFSNHGNCSRPDHTWQQLQLPKNGIRHFDLRWQLQLSNHGNCSSATWQLQFSNMATWQPKRSGPWQSRQDAWLLTRGACGSQAGRGDGRDGSCGPRGRSPGRAHAGDRAAHRTCGLWRGVPGRTHAGGPVSMPHGACGRYP